jgi:hypothetical protein
VNDEAAQGKGPGPRVPLGVISCAVLDGEVEHYLKSFDHVMGFEIMEQGLHNEPPKLRQAVQEAVARLEADTRIEAIALVYGLCSRGTEGIKSKRCRLVMARAHDCITLLLGDKDRYARYVKENPGTYWYSPGWNRHHTPPGKERYEKRYREYCEKYGEDNAEFLMDTELGWMKSYSRATYVHLPVVSNNGDVDYTRQCADWLGWDYDFQKGDPKLLHDLLACQWDDERFIVLNPGQTFELVTDHRVVVAVDASDHETS